MRRYLEFAREPMQRNGTMIPVTAYADILKLDDTGYCSVYQFDEAAVLQIRAQKNAQGLGRFPVYTDRLWMDFDGLDTSEAEVAKAKQRAGQAAQILSQLGASFTIWSSGGKGYHICSKITPMAGHGVPHSQATYVASLGISCDMSLYQHGRLLSNPGRLHKKTGKKKHLIHTHAGSTLLTVPYLECTPREIPVREELTTLDQAKLIYSRMGMFLESPGAQEPGNRHTALWSLAMSAIEYGMSQSAVWENLLFLNSVIENPKPIEELQKCLTQAINQSR